MRARLLLLILFVGCKAPSTSDGASAAPILDEIASRTEKLRDYSYAGTIAMGEQEVAFSYALLQPQRLRLEFSAPMHRRTVFDGQLLLELDDDKRTFRRRDLSKTPPDKLIALLHETFGDYACEGFKPPLLLKDGIEARRDRDEWIVEFPLDDALLDKVRYRFGDKGDFVSRETKAKDGQVVSSLRALKTLKHEQTGLGFPTAWERREGQGAYTVELKNVRINEGLDVALFATEIPSGYSELSP